MRKIHKSYFINHTSKRKFGTLVFSLFILLTSLFIFTKLTSPALAQWWSSQVNGTSWSHRKQLTVTNSSSATLSSGTAIAITIDTQTLSGNNSLKPDCSDLRIVYQDGTNITELTRYIDTTSGTTCATSGSTRVYIQLQAALTSGTSSTYYYLYYGNLHATAPASTDAVFSVGSKTATLVCPFDGSTTCAAGETNTAGTPGAIRYSGSKSALSFNGVYDADSVSAAYNSSLYSNTALTVEMWIKSNTTDTATTRHLLVKGTTFSSSNYMLQVAGGRAEFSINNYTYDAIPTSGNIMDLNWHHIAGVWDGSTVKVYTDGVVGQTVASGATMNADNSTGVKVDFLDSWLGIIDEVRISNVARYTSNFTAQTSPFVRDSHTMLLYHFDENGNDPRNTGKALDDSGNTNHGTITGAAYVSGLVGVDASTSDTGNIGRGSYAGHEGVMVEESTTNKITNPSFENGTFNTNWTETGTIDTQVAAGLNDVHWTNVNIYSNNAPNLGIASNNPGDYYSNATRFTGLTFSGTINVSYLSFRADSGSVNTNTTHTTWADDQTNPGQITSRADGIGRTKTTASASTTWGQWDSGSWYNTSSLNDVIQELVNSYTISNSTVQFITTYDGIAGEIYKWAQSYDQGSTLAPKLHIEYTTTPTQNTTAPYVKFGNNSAKVVGGGNTNLTTSVNAGNTNTHTLSAYVYDGSSGNIGGTVGATTAQLVFNGTAQTTTYTNVGGGWWRLSYAAATGAGSQSYGVQVKDGKTVYVDGFQLEATASPTTYTDGTLGTGYAWTGTANASTSTRTAGAINYPTSSNITNTVGTISMWVKYPIASTQYPGSTLWYIFETDDNGSGDYFGLRYDKYTNEFVFQKFLSYTPTSVAVAKTFSANDWVYLTATWSNSAGISLRVNNGTATTNANTTMPSSFGTSLYFYQNSPPEYRSSSYISDFRIYNAVLSATEITDVYNAGLVSHSEDRAVDAFSDNKGQNPVAVWHINEAQGSTANDASTYNNPLTLTSTTWNTDPGAYPTQRKVSLKFNGTSSVASRAWDSDFDFGTDSFSISGWFKHPSAVTGTDTILARYGSAGYKVYMNSSGYICFDIDSDSTWGSSNYDSACTTTSFADSKWHHFEAVKGASSIVLYLDGLSSASDVSLAATGTLNSSATLYIGADSNGTSNYWDGQLDEIMIYPTARTAAQVKTDLADPVSANFGSNPTDPLTNGLVGYWKLDESSGTTAYSSSGNNTDGIITPGTGSFVASKYGNGYNFDGADTVIKIYSPELLTNPGAESGTAGWTAAGTHTANFNSFTGQCTECNHTPYVHGDTRAFNWTPLSDNTDYAYQDVSLAAYSAAVSAGTATVTATGWLTDGEYHSPPYDKARMKVQFFDAGNSEIVASTYDTGERGDLSTWQQFGLTNSAIPTNAAKIRIWIQAYEAGWAGGTIDDLSVKVSPDNTFNDLPSNGLSLSAWVKPTNMGENNAGVIIAKNTGTTPSSGWLLQFAGTNGLTFTVDGTTDVVRTTNNNTVTLGAWNHVVLSWNGDITTASTVHIFVNGTEATYATTTNGAARISDTSSTLLIGNDSTSARTFNGPMDDVRVYSRALSPAEVSALYNWAPGPVGYWKMDEGSGNAMDSSGNNYTGTWYGNSSHYISGKFGKGGGFNSAGTWNGDYINTNVHPDTILGAGTNSFTLEAWIYSIPKTASYVSNGTILGAWTNTGVSKCPFGITSDQNYGNDYIFFQMPHEFGAGYCANTNIGTPVLYNQWHHYAATFNSDNNKMVLYQDSVYVGEDTWGITGDITWSGTVDARIAIGSDWDTSFFSGIIDEAKIYNYIRTQKQIVEDMNGGHPAVTNQSMVGHWDFNEGYLTTAHNTGILGSTADGTLSGATKPSWSNSGKIGKALNFGGTTAWVAMASDVTPLKITSDLTLSAWINLTNISSAHDIICKYTGTAATSAYCLNTNTSGNLVMSVVNATGPAIVTTTGSKVLSTATWYHVAGTFNSASAVTLYINGILDTRNTTSIPTTLQNPTTILDIGAENAGSNLMNGLIDEPKVYNYALTADEVKLDYNQGATVVMGALSTNSSNVASNSSADSYCPPGQGSTCTAPIAEWKMDENTGTTANDTSGNGHTGDLASGATSPKWVSGKIGSSLSFSQTTDYISIPSITALNGKSAFTISTWIKPAFASNAVSRPNRTIYIYGNYGPLLYFVDNGSQYRLSCEFWNASATDYNAFIEDLSWSANTWHHLECRYTGSKLEIYWDGAQVKSLDASGNVHNNGDPTYISSTNPAGTWLGSIDQFELFDYTRTPAQIAWDYNKGAPIAQYDFDECSGAVLHDTAPKNDRSSTAYDGTIYPNTGRTTGTCNSGVSTEMWNGGTSGKYSSSLKFDGAGDYVSVTRSTALNLFGNPYSISVWIKDDTDAGTLASLFHRIVSTANGTVNIQLGLGTDGPGSYRSFYIKESNDATAKKQSSAVGTGWFHVVGTSDGSTYHLYVNGVLNEGGSGALPGTYNTDTGLVYIGQRGNGAYVNGQIDDVRIYNYALNATQIKLLYNNNSAVQFGPLTGSP